MEKQKVIMSQQLEPTLTAAIAACEHDRLFLLTDTTTRELCLPVVAGYPCLDSAQLITIGATDANKTLDSLAQVWSELQRGGATRHSLMVNLGGGMVTDLGGFAASTFKRGIAYINIPTTLLAMVDASVGGKTGINFGGLKNEVGVFSLASSVILDTTFLLTLDHENLLSGYAEMLKHALIASPEQLAELLRFPLSVLSRGEGDAARQSLGELQGLLAESVAVKQRIVDQDPTEQGLRKALNLGHTMGHAFESLALERHRPVLHGYAVAYGLIGELYLSATKCGFPTDRLYQTVQFVREHYGKLPISCKDYERLLELMTHDKKNRAGEINFTLLADVGDLRINQTATDEEIRQALDFYQDS